MNCPRNISGRLTPQDKDGGQDLCRNGAQFAPPRESVPDGAVERPRPRRNLLADHMDRQFPLIRPA